MAKQLKVKFDFHLVGLIHKFNKIIYLPIKYTIWYSLVLFMDPYRIFYAEMSANLVEVTVIVDKQP